MKRFVCRAAVLTFASAAIATSARAQQAQTERPQLVVLISVDQMRADLVDRYASEFTGGFKRFLDDGFRFTQASHAHAVTHTAAGHATLSTGCFPSRSGIVANNWRQKVGSTWQDMYAVQDTASHIVGVQGLEGRSPRNLLRTGLADWVAAADPDALVVSLSGKDRAAITMAGKSHGQVYWLAPSLGRFVTSVYYRDSYPDWITRFNDEQMPVLWADTAWVEEVPAGERGLARADSADYENGGHSTFPHLASQEGVTNQAQRYAWLASTPASDRAVAALAQAAVSALDLGQRGHVDYLGLSFSSTDYVGHAFGPYSQEQLDNLLRLDKELGALFAFLDANVGAGRWVAALSADHGVLPMPEYLRSEGQGAARVNSQEFGAALTQAVRDARAAGGTDEAIAQRLARTVEERGLVAKAYTERDLTVHEPVDSFAVLFRNSHYPGRAAGWLSVYGVEVRTGYEHLVAGPTGTSHGSPYWYDRHVPFMLLGAGVEKGSSDQGVYTVDVAPTLAALADIATPDDLDGRDVYR
ncbi:MAG: alkaline phosphatase family protein [Gemmatimonadales bacterium]